MSGDSSVSECGAPATHRSEDGSPVCRRHAEKLYGQGNLPEVPAYDTTSDEYKSSVKAPLAKLMKVTQSRPLPEGVEISHLTGDGGERPHILARLKGKKVGSLEWSPSTGYVHYVEADHPTILAHMALHAHLWAQAKGQMGPLTSDTVTRSGERLVKGFGASFAPDQVRRY